MKSINKNMYQVLYLSNAKQRLSDDELESLLTQARDRNAQHGLTGMLVYHDGSFIQILEGEKPVVEKVLNSILNDPRHDNIIVVDEQEISQRSFPDWSMAYKKITQPELDQHPAIKQLFSKFDDDLRNDGKLNYLVDAFLNLIVK